ncbi:(2Fe-2S)-binding protein [Usitatibacter palustris]|uniref:Bacterioferritin-associated ferredoxin n=1 Tax=Usitatibacter palustris TaxID=2732487 RepID=A0A6M4H9S7_9PROT|nr:(2Fe-2S)-binding protein [Usitatibacter palustris]QJR15154.1 hypothetical protein DSM104440_01971 [Usitatibacter palustris]
MYICICNAVTEREIEGAVQLGCRTLSDLQRDLGVASCCGKCAPDTRKLLRRCTKAGAGCAAACGAGDD